MQTATALKLDHADTALPTGAAIDQQTFDALRAEAHLFQRRVQRKSHLFRTGQPFDALYLVHAGQFRMSVLSDDGHEKVTGFRFRGDLLGLDAIGTSTYASDAMALDMSQVLVIPVAQLPTLCQRVPRLQSLVTDALAAELRRDSRWQLTFGCVRAEQRVASFLLDLAGRQRSLGFSGTRLLLRMTRADIGNFLGLQLETVTRVLSRFQQAGLLDVSFRDVGILDAAGLAAAATSH